MISGYWKFGSNSANISFGPGSCPNGYFIPLLCYPARGTRFRSLRLVFDCKQSTRLLCEGGSFGVSFFYRSNWRTFFNDFSPGYLICRPTKISWIFFSRSVSIFRSWKLLLIRSLWCRWFVHQLLHHWAWTMYVVQIAASLAISERRSHPSFLEIRIQRLFLIHRWTFGFTHRSTIRCPRHCIWPHLPGLDPSASVHPVDSSHCW